MSLTIVKPDFDLGAAMRAEVCAIEGLMRKGQTIELPVVNYFSKGVYAREMHIPKGTVVSGKIHKHFNLNIMSKGELSVLTENGVVRVKAPYTLVSPPGTKRIAYAHEDTIWTTIHGTDETDVDKIEAEFVAQDEAEYIAFVEAAKLTETKMIEVKK